MVMLGLHMCKRTCTLDVCNSTFHIWCAAADEAKEQLLLEGLLKDLRIEAEVHVSHNCGCIYVHKREQCSAFPPHPLYTHFPSTQPTHTTHTHTSIAPCTTLPLLTYVPFRLIFLHSSSDGGTALRHRCTNH